MAGGGTMKLDDVLKKRKFRKYMEREVVVAIRQMLDHNQNGHAFEVGTTPDGTQLAMLMVLAPTTWVDEQMDIMAKKNSDYERMGIEREKAKTESKQEEER